MSFYFKFLPLPTRFQPPAAMLAPEPLCITILVFKTDIHNILDIKKVEETIGHLEGILRWNVDLDDIEKVLRIEATHNDPARITGPVSKAGFFCEELPD
jgi:hypothetical protein